MPSNITVGGKKASKALARHTKKVKKAYTQFIRLVNMKVGGKYCFTKNGIVEKQECDTQNGEVEQKVKKQSVSVRKYVENIASANAPKLKTDTTVGKLSDEKTERYNRDRDNREARIQAAIKTRDHFDANTSAIEAPISVKEEAPTYVKEEEPASVKEAPTSVNVPSEIQKNSKEACETIYDQSLYTREGHCSDYKNGSFQSGWKWDDDTKECRPKMKFCSAGLSANELPQGFRAALVKNGGKGVGKGGKGNTRRRRNNLPL